MSCWRAAVATTVLCRRGVQILLNLYELFFTSKITVSDVKKWQYDGDFVLEVHILHTWKLLRANKLSHLARAPS